MKIYKLNSVIVAPLVVALCALGISSVVQATPMIYNGVEVGANSAEANGNGGDVSAIHGSPTPPFPPLGDGHHMSWFGLDEDLSTPDIVDVSYSFNWSAAIQAFFGGIGDSSSADQKARMADAFAAWGAATPGLNFFEVAGVGTISAGTAANFNGTGFPGALGLGGGLGSVHTAAAHNLINAFAIQNNGAVPWNNLAGAPPAGQWDYLTVATQEVGHAIGLGHNPDATSVMNGSLPPGVRRSINGDDSASVNFLYPRGADGTVPEPGTLLLLATGLLGLAAGRRRLKKAA